MSSAIKIAKPEVLALLSLANIEDLNAKLLEMAESLQQQRKRVPDEIANPSSYDTLTQKSLGLLRDFLKPSENLALPASEESQYEPDVNDCELPVSDSDVSSQPFTESDLTTTDEGAIASDSSPSNSSIISSTGFIPQVSIGVKETLISATQQVNTLAGVELSDAAFNALKTGFLARTEAHLNETFTGLENELEQSLKRLHDNQKAQKQSESDSLGKLDMGTRERLAKMTSFFNQIDISKV